MLHGSEFIQKLFSVENPADFESLAMAVFHDQYARNVLYHDYCDALKIAPDSIKKISNIPFLPIEFFKTHDIRTGEYHSAITFTSSGTTGISTSKHHVRDLKLYEQSFFTAFEKFYGQPREWVILGLLPSYLERSGSSLIYMVEKLVAASEHPDSGFFLYNHEELEEVLKKHDAAGQKCLLIGVTFALLDFAGPRRLQLNHTLVMETGGMKGRGEELTREEVSVQLKKAFGCQSIHSEYGMTELMSQAYSKGEGIFQSPPWMKVLIRDTSDPLNTTTAGRGALNIIDLANLDSCAFIATQDIGIVHDHGHFEVHGRMDNSDIRGCNLLVL